MGFIESSNSQGNGAHLDQHWRSFYSLEVCGWPGSSCSYPPYSTANRASLGKCACSVIKEHA